MDFPQSSPKGTAAYLSGPRRPVRKLKSPEYPPLSCCGAAPLRRLPPGQPGGAATGAPVWPGPEYPACSPAVRIHRAAALLPRCAPRAAVPPRVFALPRPPAGSRQAAFPQRPGGRPGAAPGCSPPLRLGGRSPPEFPRTAAAKAAQRGFLPPAGRPPPAGAGHHAAAESACRREAPAAKAEIPGFSPESPLRPMSAGSAGSHPVWPVSEGRYAPGSELPGYCRLSCCQKPPEPRQCFRRQTEEARSREQQPPSAGMRERSPLTGRSMPERGAVRPCVPTVPPNARPPAGCPSALPPTPLVRRPLPAVRFSGAFCPALFSAAQALVLPLLGRSYRSGWQARNGWTVPLPGPSAASLHPALAVSAPAEAEICPQRAPRRPIFRRSGSLRWNTRTPGGPASPVSGYPEQQRAAPGRTALTPRELSLRGREVVP